MHSSMNDNRNFTYSIQVQSTEIDALGHVNHAKYLEYFEWTRWQWLKERGWTPEHIRRTGLSPIVLGANIRYRKELKLFDQVSMTCEVQKYTGKIGKIQQNMTKADGPLAADLEITFGLFDIHERKLLKPTPEWLEAIRAKKIWTD